MQRLLLLGLAALVALGGSAAAHYDGSANWHDFGTSLGGFGPSPAGQPLGLCWTTDSTFLDPSDPGGFQPSELFGHTGGLGVDYDRDCHEQGRAPSAYGSVTAPEEGEVAVSASFAASAPPLP